MKTLFKHIKPYTVLVIIALAALVVQAVSELALPLLMSSMVDDGLQRGGNAHGAPTAITAEAMELFSAFSSQEDKDAIQAAYSKAGDAKQEQYPELSGEDYILTGTPPDGAFIRASEAIALYLQSQEKGINSLYSDGVLTLDPASLPDVGEFIADAADSGEDSQNSALINGMIGTSLGEDAAAKRTAAILSIGVQMLIVMLISVTGTIVNNYLSTKVATGVSATLRREVFAKVISMCGNEMNSFSTASLITRTTNDIQQVQMLVTMSMRIMCFAPIMGIGGTVLALTTSVSMSWICGVAVLLLLGIILIMLAIVLPKFSKLQKLVDKLNLVSRENLSGLLVIRAFGNEEHEEKRFENTNRELMTTTRFVQRASSVLMPSQQILMNLTSVAVIWFGAQSIAASTLQIGDMMAYLQYASHIIFSFMIIAMMFVMVPRAMVSAKRIAEVLNSPVSITDKPDAAPVGALKGEIAFNNVCFRYSNAEEDVLHNITFTAHPAQTTAFIGSTGSGKSTLINLLPRFFDVTSGSITIDGIDLRDMTQNDLRRNIGYIPQKGMLFSGTVMTNLKYGREDADEADARAAVDTAQASFVYDMPEGLEAPISQSGANVSGGQKQRISIARALIKNSPIYIFDDSFSALDFKTDAALRQALHDYTSQAAVLIVAQRISTIMHADKIIVLDKGRVVGQGTHSELLRDCEQYREIAESQLAKEELK